MEWIDVSDRLPKPNTWILYYAPIFENSPNVWVGQYSDGVFFSKAGFFGGGEVTHWAELSHPRPKRMGILHGFLKQFLQGYEEGKR